MVEKNILKLERLQERALRFVYNDKVSSYEELLTKGDFLSLSMYRIYFLAIEVFKCFKGLNPEYLNELFEKKHISYNLRNSDLIVQQKFDTKTHGYKSFSYFGAKVWNTLPQDLKNSESISSFKIALKLWCKGSTARLLNNF